MRLYVLKSLFQRRQRKIMLVVELFFSFLAFFFILTFIVREINNSKYSLGFEHKNLYTLKPEIVRSMVDPKSISNAQQEIMEYILSHPNVEYTGECYSSNFFVKKGYMSPVHPLKSNNVSIPPNRINQIYTTDKFDKILGLKMLEGRWYNSEDNASKNRPVVLTQNLKEELFGNSKALGKVIDYGGQQCIIVGVCNNLKHKGDYTPPELSIFVRRTKVDGLQYTNQTSVNGSYCGQSDYIKCKDTSDAFAAELTQGVATKFPGFRIKLYSMEDTRNKYIRKTWTPLIVILLVVTSIFLNVLFGLFGVLWYNISQRKSEIGLRMAVGASKTAIYRQFITEMLLLTTIAIIPGIIIAIQFPILNILNMEPIVYVVAIILAAVVIYGMVVLCALFPSSRATKIQPAIALHEE